MSEQGGAEGGNDRLTYDELHQLRRRRGYARKNSKAVLKMRLSPMDTMDRKRARDVAAPMDTSEGPPEVWGKRCRVVDLHLILFEEREVEKGPQMKERWNA